MDLTNAFALFINCYVYGSIAYLSTRLLIHLSLCFLSLVDEYQATEPDFDNQVKDLLNPSTEAVLELDPTPSFDTMTLRELRTHITRFSHKLS